MQAGTKHSKNCSYQELRQLFTSSFYSGVVMSLFLLYSLSALHACSKCNCVRHQFFDSKFLGEII